MRRNFYISVFTSKNLDLLNLRKLSTIVDNWEIDWETGKICQNCAENFILYIYMREREPELNFRHNSHKFNKIFIYILWRKQASYHLRKIQICSL